MRGKGLNGVFDDVAVNERDIENKRLIIHKLMSELEVEF